MWTSAPVRTRANTTAQSGKSPAHQAKQATTMAEKYGGRSLLCKICLYFTSLIISHHKSVSMRGKKNYPLIIYFISFIVCACVRERERTCKCRLEWQIKKVPEYAAFIPVLVYFQQPLVPFVVGPGYILSRSKSKFAVTLKDEFFDFPQDGEQKWVFFRNVSWNLRMESDKLTWFMYADILMLFLLPFMFLLPAQQCAGTQTCTDSYKDF